MVFCMNRHVLSQHAPRFARLGIPLYLSWQSRWFMRRSELPEARFFLNLASDEFSTDMTQGVGIWVLSPIRPSSSPTTRGPTR